jgi:predicted fused transcriptional regulator/phosphomethylpyrimidine kinase
MENWNIHDPDGVLNFTDSKLNEFTNNEFKCNTISPREDILQCTNKKNGIVVDLGFYGCEVIVYVIDSNLDWESPLEKTTHRDIVSAIRQVKKFLNDYST